MRVLDAPNIGELVSVRRAAEVLGVPVPFLAYTLAQYGPYRPTVAENDLVRWQPRWLRHAMSEYRDDYIALVCVALEKT